MGLSREVSLNELFFVSVNRICSEINLRHFVHAFLLRFRCVIAQLCYAATIFYKMRFTERSQKIKELLPKIPILMLSVHDGPHLANNSQLVGAQGFVTKSQAGEVLLTAVDVLLEGGTYFQKSDY